MSIMKKSKKIIMAVGIIPFLLGIFIIALNPIKFIGHGISKNYNTVVFKYDP